MSSPPLNTECGSAPTWPSVEQREKWAIHAIPWGFHHAPPSHLFSPIDQGVSLGVILPQRHLWSPGPGNPALSRWCGSTTCNTQDIPQRVTPPYQQYRVGESHYGWMDVDCLQRFGTLQDECHACPPAEGEGPEPEPMGRTGLSCVHLLACRKAEAPAENSDIPTSWADTNGPVHGPCLFWTFPISGITPCVSFCVCFSH